MKFIVKVNVNSNEVQHLELIKELHLLGCLEIKKNYRNMFFKIKM